MEEYFSEEAVIRAQLQVEEALIRVLSRRGICSKAVVMEVEGAVLEITAQEVYQEEERTRHNIRALVNCICRRISPTSRPFVHLTATSMDIVDSAQALLIQRANDQLLLPALTKLLTRWINLAEQERDTLQIGRTHGQHALPITFGLYMAVYVQRLGERMERLQETGKNLRGKMAGAVGAYNGAALFFPDPIAFEEEVMEELNLKQSPISTQIVPPEYLLDYLHTVISTFGILANFSDDMRHLQRTEIGEVGEHFASDQVGSSTMPQKRNPINYENVKSMWKAFMPRIMTHYLDQISEHQRDLTNSASSRFIPELMAGFYLSINRLERVCRTVTVDREAMSGNLKKEGSLIMAEPLYLLLSAAGCQGAHELVRQLTLTAQEKGESLLNVLSQREDLASSVDALGDGIRILSHPEDYIGAAKEKVQVILSYWREQLRKNKGGRDT